MIEGDNSSLQKINKNEMGMESLYKMVHVFLGDIVQTKNISDSFLSKYFLFFLRYSVISCYKIKDNFLFFGWTLLNCLKHTNVEIRV